MKSIDVPIKSDLHKTIVNAVKARRDLSEFAMKDAHKRWNRSEEDFQAYIPLNDADKSEKVSRDVAGTLNYQKIIVPYGYSMLMTAHTYFASTLLGRDPVFQYVGAHGEPEMNVHAVEALTAYQMRHGYNTAVLYLWLMDVAKYGLGVAFDYWDQETHYVSRMEEREDTILGMPLLGRKKKQVRVVDEVQGYEGANLFNTSPYDYLPDTRVPLSQPNRGEFVGRKLKLSYNDIIAQKLRGVYVEENADMLLKRMRDGRVDDASENYHSSIVTTPGEDNYMSNLDPKTGLNAKMPCIEMIVEIVPKLWGIGELEFPEKWVFTITDEPRDCIVLGARPYGMVHNRFPVHVLEMEMDAYSLIKRGMLDIARPMNEVLTWLFNSHFFNVERSLNGELVFDPSKVYASDVLDPKPGKRIRLRPEAYGTDVRTAIHALSPGAESTQNNFRDMGVVTELLQQSLGVNEGMLGNTPGGRTSATASRIATTAATSRLKTIVDYFSATGFQSLSLNLLQNAQQLYDGTKKFKIAGDLPNNAQTFVEVTPELLAGGYEYVPVDGSMPVDRVATVNMWAQLLNQFRQYPGLAEQYDVGKIIGWVMQQGGIKNLKQFKVEAMDPEVIAAKRAKGELMPIGGTANEGVGGGSSGVPGAAGSTEDADRAAATVPNPGQSGGMGRTV
jgi:hypothetical protein